MAKTKAPNLDLQRERFRQQMTRANLSRSSGISRKALLDIETGRTRPRLDTAARVAKALNVQITDVFDMGEVIG